MKSSLWSLAITVLMCCFLLTISSTNTYALNFAADTSRVNSLLDEVQAVADRYTLSPAALRSAEFKARLAEKISSRTKYDAGQGRSWFFLSKLYTFHPANDSVQVYARRAAKFYHLAKQPLMEAKANMLFVRYITYRFASIAEAEGYCDAALKTFNRLAPKSELVGDAIYMKSMFFWSRRDKKNTIKYCNKAVDIYRATHSPHLSRAYIFLGNIYGYAAGDLKGFDYTFKGLQIADRNRDSAAAFSGSATLAEFYRVINDSKKWIAYLEKAKTYVSFETANNRAMYVARNLADAYNSQHQYHKALALIQEGLKKGRAKDDEFILMHISAMDTYTYLKKFHEAAAIYPFLDHYANQKSPRWLWPLNARLSAVRYLIATGKYDQASRHLEKVFAERNREGMSALQKDYEYYAFKVDSARSKMNSAIRHYQRYVVIRDSVNNADHDREVANLQIRYETAKKDIEITQKNRNISLLTRQGELREMALSNQTRARNWSISAVVLLGLILGLGYNRYKIKQRSNLYLQEQQLTINDQNQKLRALLTERDWLLKEVHHRTKNNLQIVISLLNSQLANIKDNAAYDIVRESQFRMHSISLIHHKLYQGNNPSGVDMAHYINELVEYLHDSFHPGRSVQFELDLEGLSIDISQAVPLGLIINEAITNSLKYAFERPVEGPTIKIRLKRSLTDGIELLISDNGCGLLEGFDPGRSKSLGMRLMIGLSRQLRSKINFLNANGLSVQLLMPKVKMVESGESDHILL